MSMQRVDFLISNASHHLDTFLPVIEELKRRGSACRVLSLCELRGFSTPVADFESRGIEVRRILPADLRPSPASGRGGGDNSRGRDFVRTLAWHAFLRWRMQRYLAPEPAAAVIPNDAAFPLDRACRLFRRRGVPVVVLQEGIRFATPRTSADGTNGASLYAVWGPSSAAYFERQGVPRDRIRITGCPRFDHLTSTDWSREGRAVAARLGLTESTLLFLSNPIDDLGLTSTDGKLELFRRFAMEITPLLAEPSFKLLVKLHRRESIGDFQRAVSGQAIADRIVILRDEALHPLIAASQAAIMFASTAGLEVLLLEKPLALLEIPGTRFPLGFVASHAARGLTWDTPLSQQIQDWASSWDDHNSRSRRRRFVDETLAERGNAAGHVTKLLSKLASARRT